MRIVLYLVTSLLATPVTCVAAESVQVSGSLVAVATHSVWVEQPDGVVIVARLADSRALNAPMIAGRFKTGDYVLAKAIKIDPSFSEAEPGWTDLELKSLEYLRPPTADELTRALSSPPGRRRDNVLRNSTNIAGKQISSGVDFKSIRAPETTSTVLSGKDPLVLLQHSREVTSKYLAALPNFTADESGILYTSPVSDKPRWQSIETVQSEVSFRFPQETHRNIVRNGRPWNDSYDHFPPAARAGWQHSLLRNVFDNDCDVNLQFAGRSAESGTPVLTYKFSVPPNSCFGPVGGRLSERYFAARSGEISIGEDDGLVRRIECIAEGLPKGFFTEAQILRGRWEYIKIADEMHLLPTEVQSLTARSNGTMTLSVRSFKNHRHFESSSSVTYK